MEEVQIDNVGFESLLREKRHKELFKVLTEILNKLKTYSSVDLSSVQQLLENIHNVQKEVPASINALSAAILKKMEQVNKPSEWTFVIDRDSSGYITTITAKQK